MRSHKPQTIIDFFGLWDRGDVLSCPPDHFTDCENLQFGNGFFKSREGITPYQTAESAIPDAIRIYNYKTAEAEGVLALTSEGDIYHILGSSTIYGPILSIPEMTDFGFTQWAGRAYITPYATFIDAEGDKYQKGLENEFLYVYLGDGSSARPAGANKPTGIGFTAANSGAPGFTDAGFHIFAVVYETDTGYFTQPGPAIFATLTTLANEGVTLTNIPVSPDSFVTKRHIVATAVIENYNGDQTGYQFFFVETIEDNVTTTLTFSFYDAELIEDASYLLYVLESIPAGVAITTYHNRIVLTTTFDDISLLMVSVIGEPENISELNGYMIFPLDSRPITNVQEFRDVLYAFKITKTGSFIDNGGDPATWPFVYIDQGVGTPVHGIAKVLDSEGINVNYIIIADYSGILLFNGAYARPELTYKIVNRWLALERNDFHYMHFANDSVGQLMYVVLPDGTILFADYSEGLDPKKIKFCPWSFDGYVSTVCLVNTNQLLIGTRPEE